MYTAQELMGILRRAEAEGFYGHVGAEGAKDAADAIERLTAENERLRAALGEIAAYNNESDFSGQNIMSDIARRAINQQQTRKE